VDIKTFKTNYQNKKNINFDIIKKEFDKKGYIITSDDPTTIKLIDSSNLKTRTVDTIKQTVNKNVNAVKNKGVSIADNTTSIFKGDIMLSNIINDIDKDIDKIMGNVNKINSTNNNFKDQLNTIFKNEQTNKEQITDINKKLILDKKNDVVIPRSASPISSDTNLQSSAELKSFINEKNVNIFDNKLNEVINIIKNANNGIPNIELDYIIIDFTNSNNVKITFNI
jgi:hypothetical protein